MLRLRTRRISPGFSLFDVFVSEQLDKLGIVLHFFGFSTVFSTKSFNLSFFVSFDKKFFCYFDNLFLLVLIQEPDKNFVIFAKKGRINR